MKYMIKLAVWVAVIVGAAAAGIYLYRNYVEGTDSSAMQVEEARIDGIREMVSLCTLEIEDEVALRDSIHGKWMFARTRLTGEVSFDLEKMEWRMSGDTIFVELPPETVTVRESTAPDAYKVIDMWDDTLVGLGKLTTSEENTLKRRQAARYRAEIYRKGYVARARDNALQTLRKLTSAIPGATVVITDPTPAGQP